MRVTLYISSFCPRCYLARRWLEKQARERGDITIAYVNILANPFQAWREGVRMVPALKAGERLLCRLFLSEREIAAFLATISAAPPLSPHETL